MRLTSNNTWQKQISFQGKTELLCALLLVSLWNCTSTLKQEKPEGSLYKQISGAHVYHSNEVSIEYQHSAQLEKFVKAIQPTPLTCAINKIMQGEGCTSPCVSVVEFLNGLRERVQLVLDLPVSRMKIQIKLHDDLKELSQAYANRSGKESKHYKAVALYEPSTKTIHLQTDNLRIEILAHEMAHAVIDQYFWIQMPQGMGEVLSQRVQEKIVKEGFLVCISLTKSSNSSKSSKGSKG